MMSDFARVVRHWSKETMMMMRCEFKEEEGGEEEQRERERERTTTKTTTTTTTFFSSSATRSTQCSVGFSCHILKLERAVYRVLHLRIFTYISHQILYCNNIYTTRTTRCVERVEATKQTPLYYVYFRSERWAEVLVKDALAEASYQPL